MARSFRKYLYNIPDIHDGAGPTELIMILQDHTAQVQVQTAKAHISVNWQPPGCLIVKDF